MKVQELIEKLREYPRNGELGCRDISVVHEGVDRPKLILVVNGNESLDPIFQFTGPWPIGHGPMDQRAKAAAKSEALFAEAIRQLAEKIAVEEDQSWRSTLHERFETWMSDLGDSTPVADGIAEHSVALTEAHLRVHGRLHQAPE